MYQTYKSFAHIRIARLPVLLLFLIQIFIPPSASDAQITMRTLSSTAQGKIISLDSFPSVYIDRRDILIWLPEDYNPQHKYNVVYMHDGQMLFDSTTTWNGLDWQVDETFSRLQREMAIRDVIVVGIPNNGQNRWAEYVPEALLKELPDEVRGIVMNLWLNGRTLSDEYLRFIVYELKPFVDAQFSTIGYPAGTFLMGSSMGGIISLYGICEYPQIFGGAACLSTHWPLNVPGLEDGLTYDAGGMFIQYLQKNLPPAHSHKIYFDYGTETLDALYHPYQLQVDSLMKAKGYTTANWTTREFPGADHSERSWARRLEVPVKFLLGKG
jgi:enterochelin esterase-like enzyme